MLLPSLTPKSSIVIIAPPKLTTRLFNMASSSNNSPIVPPTTTTATIKLFKNHNELKSSMQKYHPVLIEGPGRSDFRDATPIANRIAAKIQERIQSKNITKPILLISQGDPIDPSKNAGISSVVNHVLTSLDLKKGLVCLDESIVDFHVKDADRSNVIYEMRYSQMVDVIKEYDKTLPTKIEEKIEERIHALNEERMKEEDDNKKQKKKLEQWVTDFALLQEMTKVALKIVSGDITIAHTMEREKINKSSVTSFYNIALDLDLIHDNEMIYYNV